MPAPDTSALDAIFDASRDARVNRALDGLPAIWRDIANAGGAAGRAVREMIAGGAARAMTTTATSSDPGTPRCWRCEAAAAGDTRVALAGPSPAGLRVELCDDCLAHMADPGARSGEAIDDHDHDAHRQAAEQIADRAAAEARARLQGQGSADADA
jgi:hypothetical protein